MTTADSDEQTISEDTSRPLDLHQNTDDDPLASLRRLDEATSPVHNPFGVCFCFNLVFLGLAASLAALVALGETGPYIIGLSLASGVLWLAVNILLLEIWRRGPPATSISEEKKQD